VQRPLASATGTQSVSLGVGATVRRSETRFMRALRRWKAFRPVNAAMRACDIKPALLPFQQSVPYAKAVTLGGAVAEWHDLGCGRALVLRRGRVRLLSRGPVWEPGCSVDVQRAALRRLARWPGVTVMTPEVPVQGFGFIPLVTAVHLAVWDLSGDLRAGLCGKWRNRLIAAERSGVTARPGDAAALDRLIREEGQQRQARGYRALPEAFTRALPMDALRVWAWWQKGRLEAAMAFVVHGTTATYHLGWASEVARSAGAHPVLLMQAAEALRQEGLAWLDLGSVDTEAAPGLARFKLGTGARLHRLGATMLVLP
jgi:Acetyltransferase (GNAT) domain